MDKLLSNEDGGGIFDDPPAIAESVMMPQDHGDDDDDFDALSGQFHKAQQLALKKSFILCYSSFLHTLKLHCISNMVHVVSWSSR